MRLIRRRLSTMVATAATALTGCGLFIHSTPISKLSSQEYEILQRSGSKPMAVRLTRPATVAGFQLGAGSLVKCTGRSYEIQTAEPLTTSGVTLPAGSVLELKHDRSIVTGDVYNWVGVVHLGGTYDQGLVQGQAGDRAYFEKQPFKDAKLKQLSIRSAREMGGRMLPAGSIIDLTDDGKIKESFTPGEQRVLARERQVRKEEQARKEERCKERCAPVTNFHENSKCLANCRY